MIDPTKGAGLIQNLATGNKPQAQPRAEVKDAGTSSTAAQADSVEISEQALSLRQAEQTVRELSQQLARNQDVTLGLDPLFDETV